MGAEENNFEDELLILNEDRAVDSSPVTEPNPAKWIMKGSLENVLRSEFATQILSLPTESVSSRADSLRKNIDNFLEDNSHSKQSQYEIASLGIACLQLFVGNNWLGCPVQLNLDNFLGSDELDEASRTYLLLDGESFSLSVSRLHYLLVARVILYESRSKLSLLQLFDWWTLRYLYVHQQALEEPSQSLYGAFRSEVNTDKVKSLLGEHIKLKTLFSLEIGNLFLLYGEVSHAHEAFCAAEETSQLEIEWTGALGKRTRYQQSALAQLTLRVKSIQVTNELSGFITRDYFPKDLSIEDDTLLNRIAFVNEDDSLIPDLNPAYQAILLSKYSYMERARPRDELLREELLPLLQCVLGYPKAWSFHVCALLKRSRLEQEGKRTLERSMMQLQELVDSYAKAAPTLDQRLYYFYVSRLPTEAQVQVTLADLLLSLGAINSALDIYLRLQSWEKVIECYQLLELKHKAEEVVRQEMAKQPTSKLWCVLGNCTDDPKCYEEAWLLSKGRSARAQREWAFYFFRRKDYAAAIEHLRKSLEVNSLQERVWLHLAYACLETEDWEGAAAAYRSYCNIDSDNFEAWNNVAKCYIKLGQKARAWKALQEAVKCNFENWKVWDNLMVVSTDCGEFEEAIRCYHRMLDLKEKHVDVDVLRVLVTAVSDNKEDNYGVPAGRLGAVLVKLFGRLTAQLPNNGTVWQLYAKLTAAVEPAHKADTLVKVGQMLQKALRSSMQEPGWEKETITARQVLSIAVEFCQTCVTFLQMEASKDHVQLANSARLSVKSAITVMKRCHDDRVPADLAGDLDNAEEKFNLLVSTLATPS